MRAPLVRGGGMRPLPIPVRGGDIRRLRDFVNVRDDAEDEFALLCGAIAAMLNPFGNYLTHLLSGPPNSAKTTITMVMRDSDDFEDFLSDKYGEEHQCEINGKLEPRYPTREDLKKAVRQLQAYARRGEERDPRIRITEHEGELWIDLGTPDWSAVVVNANGWQIEPDNEGTACPWRWNAATSNSGTRG